MARTATFALRIAQVGVSVGMGVRVIVAVLVGVREGAGVSVGLGCGELVAVTVGGGVKVTVGMNWVEIGTSGDKSAWQAALDKTTARQASTKNLLRGL